MTSPVVVVRRGTTGLPLCDCVRVSRHKSREQTWGQVGAVVQNAAFCRLTRSRSCLCGFFSQADPSDESCCGSETWHHGFAIVCGSRDTGIQTRGTVVQNAAFCCLTRSRPCLCGFFSQAEHNDESCRGSETWHHGIAIV